MKLWGISAPSTPSNDHSDSSFTKLLTLPHFTPLPHVDDEMDTDEPAGGGVSKDDALKTNKKGKGKATDAKK